MDNTIITLNPQWPHTSVLNELRGTRFHTLRLAFQLSRCSVCLHTTFVTQTNTSRKRMNNKKQILLGSPQYCGHFRTVTAFVMPFFGLTSKNPTVTPVLYGESKEKQQSNVATLSAEEKGGRLLWHPAGWGEGLGYGWRHRYN